METLTEPRTLIDRFVVVPWCAPAGKLEYHVRLVVHPGSENYSLTVERQPDPGGTIWPYVFCGHASIEDCGRDALEGLRCALRESRREMRRCLQSWRANREWAALELPGNVKGSKRSYYTRHANYWHKHALRYAPQWRLAKQLWKEITRL
jgi:hypothetical protein